MLLTGKVSILWLKYLKVTNYFFNDCMVFRICLQLSGFPNHSGTSGKICKRAIAHNSFNSMDYC